MRFIAALATPLLVLAACSDTAEDAAEAAPAEDMAAVEDTQPTDLELSAGGIVIPAQNGFEQLDVPFGSMRGATETTLANVLGEVTEQGSEPNECGLTFTSFRGLTANFRDDEFVGYWAEEPYVPEIDRAAMLEDTAVTLVEDSTLDGEFTIEQGGQTINGIFAGEDEGAAVRALWAGENCIAR